MSVDLRDPLLASQVPLFRVGGEELAELSLAVVRLEVDHDCDGLKRAAAHFTAWGPRDGARGEGERYLDGRVFDFGKRLQISLGTRAAACTVFDGAISAIEAGYREGREPQALVFAEDALMRLRLTRRTRTYEAVSDADIARTIAQEHGLQANADAEGPTYPVVQQWNLSDLAFLRERARLINAELWVEGDTLSFRSRGRREGTALTLVQGNHLVSLSIRADLAHQRSAVKVAGYDVAARGAIEEEAGPAELAADGAGGRSGPAVLESAIGAFPSQRTREVPTDADQARSWARAELLRRARGFVRLSGVTRGSPDLVVGSRVRLERVAAPFAGDGYYVTRVRHSYDLVDGLRTLFEAERPTLEAAR